MNNIIEIIVLLFLVSSFVLFFSGIALCFHYIEGKEKKEAEISFNISLITFILTSVIITIYSIKNPQPTFREVCEANNGTYIDNNGRAGDSCIYNKGGGN